MRTVREFLASGDKGHFAQQLLRTYDDPCEGNFRLLLAVADYENGMAVQYAQEMGEYLFDVDGMAGETLYLQKALRRYFPVLAELDREMTASDTTRLPREAAP